MSKFFAYLEHKDNSLETINVFEALKLKDEGKIITDRGEENSSLLDITSLKKVLPKKKGKYFFSFYPKSKNKNDENDGRHKPEWTPEMQIFLAVFEKMKKFKIDLLENKEQEKEPIEIHVDKNYKLKRIIADEKIYIVDLLIELSYTKPYSNFYKWNGQLAIEFIATSHPRPIKRVSLSKDGYPLFEAKALIPKNIKLPSFFETEESYKSVVDKVYNVYSATSYRLLGKFEREAEIKPEFRDRYETMKNFEDQVEDMKKKISSLNQEESTIQKKLNELLVIQKEKQEQIKIESEKLAEYRRENEYYENLSKDNEVLSKDNISTKIDKEKLEKRNIILSVCLVLYVFISITLFVIMFI